MLFLQDRKIDNFLFLNSYSIIESIYLLQCKIYISFSGSCKQILSWKKMSLSEKWRLCDWTSVLWDMFLLCSRPSSTFTWSCLSIIKPFLYTVKPAEKATSETVHMIYEPYNWKHKLNKYGKHPSSCSYGLPPVVFTTILWNLPESSKCWKDFVF